MEQDILPDIDMDVEEKVFNITQNVDIHILAKIAAYLPRTLAYTYAYESRNKNIARNFFYSGLAQNTYLFQAKDSLEIKTFPNGAFAGSHKKDFKNHKNAVINNHVIFWVEDETTLSIFQLQPYRFVEVEIDKIGAIYFNLVDTNTIYIVNSGKKLYKLKDLAIIEEVPLVEGFCFYSIVHKNRVFSDFYGDCLVVQDTVKTHDAYKSATFTFDSTGHYYTVGPNHMIMDFCGDLHDEEDTGEHLIKDVPQLKDKPREELVNCLFAFEVYTEGVENKIKVDFVSLLPPRLDYVRVLSFAETVYMIENLEERVVSFWKKNVNLGNMLLHDEEHVNKIEIVEYPFVVVLYNKCLIIIDFMSVNVVGKYDLGDDIPKFDYLDTLVIAGNYYRCTYFLEPKEKKEDVCEQGEEKTMILNRQFKKIADIDDKATITAYE